MYDGIALGKMKQRFEKLKNITNKLYKKEELLHEDLEFLKKLDIPY